MLWVIKRIISIRGFFLAPKINVKTDGLEINRNFMYKNIQGLHRPEKYWNLEGFFSKSMKIKYASKSTKKIPQRP